MAFRGIIAVDSTEGARWEAALEVLRDGQPITYGEVRLTFADSNELHATVLSAWADRSRVDRASADRDLDRAEATVASLCADSAPFGELANGRKVVAELVSDYGMGTVLVATRIDGTTVWAER